MDLNPIFFEAPQIRRFYELHSSNFSCTPNKNTILLKLLSSPLDTPSLSFRSKFIKRTNDLFNELLEEAKATKTPFSGRSSRFTTTISRNREFVKDPDTCGIIGNLDKIFEETRNAKLEDKNKSNSSEICPPSYKFKENIEKNHCESRPLKNLNNIIFNEERKASKIENLEMKYSLNAIAFDESNKENIRDCRDEGKIKKYPGFYKPTFYKSMQKFILGLNFYLNILASEKIELDKKLNEPKDLNERLRKDEIKKRKRKSNIQLKILKAELEKEGFWSKEKIVLVSKSTGLSESQVNKFILFLMI
jgi:hypothetical protein